MLSTMLWLLLVLAFDVHLVLGYLFRRNACEDSETPFRVELQTNYFADESKWWVRDVATRDKVLKSSEYSNQYYLHEEDYCLDSDKCYQFTIEDPNSLTADPYYATMYGNEDGLYRIHYDGILIGEGSKFENDLSEMSIYFGDGCDSTEPTYHPSTTSTPTTSLVPTVDTNPSAPPSGGPSTTPSFSPSDKPSQNPSISLQPSMAPTVTPNPTAARRAPVPFEQTYKQRIRYPSRPNYNEIGSFAFQQLPNCVDEPGRVGCVALPSPLPILKQDWAGKIHHAPPKCSLNAYGRHRKCKMGLPMSIAELQNNITASIFPGFKEAQLFEQNIEDAVAVVSGDLNADGFLDVVVGFRFRENKIWMNNGNGTFYIKELDGGNRRTRSIALGDLDGDGLLDIVIANYFEPNQVLLSIDGTSYETPFDLPGEPTTNQGKGTTSIVIADMDEDEKLDVIVGNFLPGDSFILYNSGDGKNYDKRDLVEKQITSIAVGDLDNDGKNDIVLGTDNDEVILQMNNDDGNFTTVTIKTTDVRTVGLADMDGNGRLDIVVGREGRKVNFLYKNNGDLNNFTGIVLPGGDADTKDIGLGDFDGDGQVDIAVLNVRIDISKSDNQILLNRGNDVYEVIYLDQRNDISMAVSMGDFDNNGLMDMIVVKGIGGNNTIYMNIVDPEYQTIELPGDSDFSGKAVALEDLNGDNITDIIVGNEGVGDTAQPNQIYTSNKSGNYDSITLPGGNKITDAIAVADLDDNGLLDVIVGNRGEPDQILMQMEEKKYVVKELSNSFSFTTSLAVADIDGDGDLDIVVGVVDQANEIFYGDGDGNFTAEELPGDITTETIAVGDLDGNNELDIILGGHVLFNKGNRHFDPIKITDDKSIRCIALGDLNNDTHLDIVVGNEFSTNTLLINNGNGTFLPPSVLPGGDRETLAVALGDFNGDGRVDIVFGNVDSSNQLLLNNHNTSFTVTRLPGERVQTRAIAIADLDDDGVIDIVAVNRYYPVQVMFYSSCPNGGAKLHSGSWCFQCPRYMGRPVFLNYEQSSCRECMPDYMQQVGAGEQCSQDPCSLSERELGSTDCTRCGAGTYYDNTITRREYNASSWDTKRCKLCSPGHYSNTNLTAINKCFECASGTYQDIEGQSSCKNCPLGEFQPNRGQSVCNICPAGGYCNKFDVCGGGYEACKPGTYNDKQGQSNESACIECGIGTYSATNGAEKSSDCEQCAPGTFGNKTGQEKCYSCPIGKYQSAEGASECLDCRPGHYGNKESLVECASCPYRLSSFNASTTCSFCAEGFYLKGTNVQKEEIFTKPDRYCIRCPFNATCDAGTTLQTIVVDDGYWRDSPNTAELYECDNPDLCQSSNKITNRKLSSTSESDQYCKEGYRGPQCKVCVNDRQYLDSLGPDGKCVNCLSFFYLAIPISITAAILMTIGMVRIAASRYPSFGVFCTQISLLWHSIGPQAKLKIFISFYQVVTTLDSVYGVKYDTELKPYLDALKNIIFTTNFLYINEHCFGSMETRIVIGAVWPFLVIFIGFCVISVYTILSHDLSDDEHGTNMKSIIGRRTLKFAIIFIYIVLPGVSRAIFDGIKCTSFKTNDDESSKSSYLLSDLNLKCNERKSVINLFWFFFSLWPVVIPLLTLGLLWTVRHEVRSKRTTPLVEACSFLWRDYNDSMIYWEVIDLIRKIFLTGIILHFQRESGSSHIFRLLLANVVSFVYFGVLLRARPYKRTIDLDLAFLSNILLLCCFTFGIILHFCQDDQAQCDDYIGWKNMNSYRATFVILILTVSMLVISLLLLLIISLNAISAPTIRLVNTGSKPNLELPGDCRFHAFFSHIWSTGKDKTHTAVRKVQLLMPGVRIWLDADELKHVGQLEESVGECAIVLIFYTKGYFMSTNCRREVYAAVHQKKPIYVLYDSETSDIDQMKEECIGYCKDGSNIIGKVLANEPIPWLGSGGTHFAIESVKLVCLAILRHLPHYKRIPGQLIQGLKIVGEMSNEVKFKSSVDILVCQENVHARSIVEEAKTYLLQSNDWVNIYDAKLVFDEISKDRSVLYEGNNKILLLYLNEDVFRDDDGQVSELVEKAFYLGVRVLNVHELDYEMGACSFSTFFDQAPEDLINKGLFKEIAVPLYSLKEYRRVSFFMLLQQMGAKGSKKSSSENGLLASAGYHIKLRIHRLTESTLSFTSSGRSVIRNKSVPPRHAPRSQRSANSNKKVQFNDP